MCKALFGSMFLLVALSIGLLAQAQQPERRFRLHSTDLAITYASEGGRIAHSSGDRFWMHGGSAEAAFTLYRGLGVAASLSGEHAAGITPGVDLSRIAFVAGPRYTLNTARWTERWLGQKHSSRIFGETLFGAVHGFNGLFPASANTIKSSANAFAMQVGGGADVAVARGFGIRLLQVNYIRTSLPNNGSDSQHDIRVGCGVTYHLGGR